MSLSFLPGHILGTQCPQADCSQVKTTVRPSEPEVVVGQSHYSSQSRDAEALDFLIWTFIDLAFWYAYNDHAADFEYCRDEVEALTARETTGA